MIGTCKTCAHDPQRSDRPGRWCVEPKYPTHIDGNVRLYEFADHHGGCAYYERRQRQLKSVAQVCEHCMLWQAARAAGRHRHGYCARGGGIRASEASQTCERWVRRTNPA